jgi:predicted nucleic acid-binding protein
MCALKRPFDDQSVPRNRLEAEAAVVILALAEQGRVKILQSPLLVFENSRNPNALRRGRVAAILTAMETKHVPGARLRELANLYVRDGLAAIDALHLAWAVSAKVDFFVTSDRFLLKKARRLLAGGPTAVVTPIHFIQEFAP